MSVRRIGALMIAGSALLLLLLGASCGGGDSPDDLRFKQRCERSGGVPTVTHTGHATTRYCGRPPAPSPTPHR